jgi:hypothetical protein
MANDPGSQWSRLCGRRRRVQRARPVARSDGLVIVEDDPAAAVAEILLDLFFELRQTNQHLGVFMDSIQAHTQTAEQKQRRHRDNVLVIQGNITQQLRDLNAGLETIQQQHPTLALGDLFMSVHQLDSNHRALLDLAKEAAEVDPYDVPAPPRLIDVTSSLDPNKTGGAAPPEQYNRITIDQTDQPAGTNPATQPGSVHKPSPDLAPADEGTQPSINNNIVVQPGSARG